MTKRLSKPKASSLNSAPHPVTIMIIAMTITLSAVVAYHSTFNCPFIFDDEFSIEKNTSIRTLRPSSTLFSLPGGGNPVQGRPVLNLTFAVNYALGGLNVGGYHAFNLAFHILAALLLFGISRRTLQSNVVSERIRRNSTGVAFATALIWAIHPLATSAVTYVTQRAESLAALFYLLTLYCAIRAARASRRHMAIAWGAATTAACGLGMATKEVMASAPLIVFLYDGFFLSSSFKNAFRRRWPLYCALAATWIILAALVMGTGGRGGTAGFGAGMMSLRYAATQLWAVVHYLQLCFWPDPLIFDYGAAQAPFGEIFPSAIVVILLFSAILYALRRRRPIAFAGIFIAAVLAPSSSFIPITTQTIAEHRMYLPLAAVVLLTTLAVFSAWDAIVSMKRHPGSELPSFLRAVVPMALLGAAALALGNATIKRNEDYESVFTIWQDAVNKRPNNVRAVVYLGNALTNQDRSGASEEALSRSVMIFNNAIAIDSTYALAFANRGLAYYRMRRFDEALPDYNKAIALQSLQGNRAELFNNRGILLGETGHTAEAIADFKAALTLDPMFASAHNNLGSAYANLAKKHASRGDSVDAAAELTAAIRYYSDAIRCDPGLASSYRGRASVYVKMGMYREATDDCSALTRINPADAVAYGDRAICYYWLKLFTEARRDVQECTRRGGTPNPELLRLLNMTSSAAAR